MSRYLLPVSALLAVLATTFAFGLTQPETARGDVGGVYSNVPVFTPNQVVTITVTAEDDDGALVIESSLNSSELTVLNCTGLGADQEAGECDGSGMDAITNQGNEEIQIDTEDIDDDDVRELLTVTLTLIATCSNPTAVTISGDQPGNHGPDDVTINCAPATPSPTPTKTATPTPTPTFTPSPTPTLQATLVATPTPTFTPQPPAAPTATLISQVQTFISPPSTGSAGLR